LIANEAHGRIVFSNSTLSPEEETMKTLRGIGVLVVAMWWLGTGVAAGSDAKPAKGDAHGDAAVHAKGEAKVNINDASKAELMKLQGISAGAAQKIIAYREAHGPFKRAHDLVKVDGIGKEAFEKNSGRITVK
jgi:competence ComEA-like helix-hairpin-helix protein